MLWRLYLRFAVGPYAGDIPPSWPLIARTLPNALRHRIVEPAWTTLRRRLPRWVAVARLERAGDGWYRIPDHGAAVHVSLRFVEIVNAGDYVLINGGLIVAVGWMEDGRIEFEPV